MTFRMLGLSERMGSTNILDKPRGPHSFSAPGTMGPRMVRNRPYLERVVGNENCSENVISAGLKEHR